MNKKAIVYSRVSSKEQEKEGFSIPAQLKLLNEYAKKNNLTVVKEYSEVETAKSSGRTEFNNMLALLKENCDVKDILVEKTDRLYRNFKDYVILEDYDLTVHLVKEGQILNKESRSHEKFIHGIKVLMAKNYLDNLSEEVRKGIQEKVLQGEYPNIAPVGFYNNKETHNIEMDEDQARLVRKIFELYATGEYSLWTLKKKIVEEGLTKCLRNPNIPASRIARILQAPVYISKILFKGKLYDAKHKPIVSRELFNEVQELLKQNGKRKGKVRKKLTYMGLLICSNCSLDITGTMKEGKYIYYHCGNYRRTCNKKAITEQRLEHGLLEVFNELRIDDKTYEQFKVALKQSHGEVKTYREAEINRLQDEFSAIRANLDKLYLDKVEKKVSEDFWETTSKKWAQDQDRLLQAIEKHKTSNINYLNAGIKALRLASTLHENYLNKGQHEKRDIIKLLLSKRTLVNANLDVELGLPFPDVAKFAKTGDMLGR